MKYYTYILYSYKIDKYYIGYTSDIEKRVERHNRGMGRYSNRGIPWELVYYEEYKTKREAIKRENEIKGKKSRDYIEELIEVGGRPAEREASSAPQK